jgi:formate dehydrogenase major subunit
MRARISDRMQPGVVYTTFHHPESAANVVTTEYTDWATDCPEYKVTAVQVRKTLRKSEWQEQYEAQREATTQILAGAGREAQGKG